MKIKRIKIVLLSTLLIGFVAVSGCSRHNNRYQSGNHDFRDHTERISRELDLTQYQEKQLEVLASNLEDKRAVVEKGHEIVEAIVQELNSDQFDEEYAAQTISNYLNEVKGVSLDFVTELSALHDTLSDEQRVKLTQQLSLTDRGHNNHYWR
jgi:Spy/CpxP family protein refolding chaperone